MKPLTIKFSDEETALLLGVTALSGVEPRTFITLLLSSALGEIETTIKRCAGLAIKKEPTQILEISGFSGSAFRSLDRLLNKKPLLPERLAPLGSGEGETEGETGGETE